MATDDLPITLSEEEREEIVWRIKVLTEHKDFDASWAGQLAAIGQLDYREALKLRRRGCPQNLVYELLS